MVMQGTILIDFDHGEMAGLLKTRSKTAATLVTSLADRLGRVPPVAEVQAALLAELRDAWDGASVASELRADELALSNKLLAAEIGTDAFVAGTQAKHERASA